nr:DUF3883 domain-containing protein [Bacteroides intestinalis]
MRILFANIGWMIHYQGNSTIDMITGGGSYKNDDKHEAYNFQDLNGFCYGYVQPVRWGTINLKKIDSTIADSDSSLDNVLVIWTARRPDIGGTYVIGWYKNATVYKNWQEIKAKERCDYNYNIVAKSKDCTLLSVDDRCFEIPRAKTKKNEGFMGQSNVWFANKNIAPIIRFKESVVKYVESTVKQKEHKQKNIKINIDAKKEVENIAILTVTQFYEARDYKVESVEKENLGWDLVAIKDKVKLHIEVKGLADEPIVVRITQNEYSKMRSKDNSNYRLCVVTNALKTPILTTFIFDGKNWVCDKDSNIQLNFDEQIAAIAYVK